MNSSTVERNMQRCGENGSDFILRVQAVPRKAGVYHVGLMWQCTPEYSWIQGAVDHTFCEPKYIDEDGDLSPRNDCWSGVWQNYYLEGCVPDATQFAGEFLGY